jgi:hypothetical protein
MSTLIGDVYTSEEIITQIGDLYTADMTQPT